jgi:hypothetical protein
MLGQQSGDGWAVTATHATAASASKAGVAGKTHFITDISASSDKAGALMLVKQGTTVIWRSQVQTSAAGYPAYEHTFSTPLRADSGALVSVEIDGTSVCHANIAGYTL